MKKKKYSGIKMDVMHYETKDEVMRDGISLSGISTATFLLGVRAGDNALKILNEHVEKGSSMLQMFKNNGLGRLH